MKRLLKSKKDYQKTILRNQLTSLILYESVTTTLSRAKLLESYANHFLHRIRNAALNDIKLAYQELFNKQAVKKTFAEILPRYPKETSSYVKVIKLPNRKGDNATQALVAWIKGLNLTEPSQKGQEKVTKGDEDAK